MITFGTLILAVALILLALTAWDSLRGRDANADTFEQMRRLIREGKD